MLILQKKEFLPKGFSIKKKNITWVKSVRLLTVTLLILVLLPVVLASTEIEQIGPYKISFNMNTDIPYQIQTQAPVTYPLGAIYPLVIATDNTTGASISITQYNNKTISSLEVNEEIAGLRMALGGLNVTAPEKIIIDNMTGFLISGIPLTGTFNAPKLYQAQYWLDSKDCECGPISVGEVLVTITSSYPQEVTQGLLNSIHVAASQTPSSTTITPSVDYLSPDISQRITSGVNASSEDWLRPDRSIAEPVQQNTQASASIPQYPTPSQIPASSSLSNVTATIAYPGMGIFQVYVDGIYVGTGTGGSLTFEVKGGVPHVISIWDGFWAYQKEIFFEPGLSKIINVEAV
jgi:hypothetical protein